MNKTESHSSNQAVFKAISLFGGVQFIRMLAGVVQTKVVAVFVGAEGIGVLSILRSIVAIIESISSVGLSITAVREFTIASTSEDSSKFPKSYKILLAWSLASGIVGLLLTLALSPFLSQWSFGNSEYITAIVLVSISLLFNSLATFYSSTLQGLRLLKYLAKSAIYSTIISVLINVFLLYFFKKDGIVFSIVSSSAITMLFSLYFASKYKFAPALISFKEIWVSGSVMVRYGILITVSGLITNLFLYLLKIYIVQNGGIVISGLYQAGSTIFESYFAMIFIAMATDYYPRLTMHSEDNLMVTQTVNQQALMNLLLVLPIVLVFIPFVPFAIRILYSSTFVDIVPYVYWATFGLILKSASWSMGYILFAKGNSKQILFNSIGFNIIFLLLHILFFYFYGLVGLGIAYFLYYLIHFCCIFFITNRLYGFKFSQEFYVYLILAICFGLLDVLISLYQKSIFGYSIILLLFCISAILLLKNTIGLNKFRNYLKWES